MSTQWYYADRDQQQQGPVDAIWLQAAFGRGELDASSLVWRDGLAAWQPLSQIGAELGIAMPASLPPNPMTRRVVAAPSSGMPVLAIVLIVGVVLVFVLGILAAIAIPAYHDYSQRAKVMQGLSMATPLKLTVTEFVLENERCPVNEEANIRVATDYASGALQAIHVGELADTPEYCEIRLLYDDLDVDGAEETLSLIYRGPGNWGYRSTLPARMLPASIRDQLER